MQRTITLTLLAGVLVLQLVMLVNVGTENGENPADEHLELSNTYEEFTEYYIVCDGEMHQFMVSTDISSESELPTCKMIK